MTFTKYIQNKIGQLSRAEFDNIIADFNKTIQKLNLYRDQQDSLAESYRETAEEALALARQSLGNAAKAERVASNLENLVNGE